MTRSIASCDSQKGAASRMIPVVPKGRPAFFRPPEFVAFRDELWKFYERGGTRKTQQVFAWRARLDPFEPAISAALTRTFGAK